MGDRRVDLFVLIIEITRTLQLELAVQQGVQMHVADVGILGQLNDLDVRILTLVAVKHIGPCGPPKP